MFNEGFFPTPSSAIVEMWAALGHMDTARRLSINILEPSAGKGDILDFLVQRGVPKENLRCIEIEPELQAILHGKGYAIVGSNFLEYDDRYQFDAILMNPPFADGAAHLLKAWNLLRAGSIVCLLNAETVNNPYSAERRILSDVIAQHGTVKALGKAFRNAPRQTDVEVVMVHLRKEAAKVEGFDVRGMDFDAQHSEQEFNPSPLANADIIQALVDQCTRAIDLCAQIDALERQRDFYLNGIYHATFEENKARKSLNERIDAIKRSFWEYVFEKTRLGSVTPTSFRAKMDATLDKSAHLAFSRENVMAALEQFYFGLHGFMQESIIAAFDAATSYHKNNRIEIEGWVSNAQWRINKKIVIPTYGDSWRRRQDEDFMNDLDKVMCYLSGVPYEENQTVAYAISRRVFGHRDYKIQGELEVPRAERVARGDLLTTRFFDVRVYHKGTVHLTFRDKDLLARFNQAAAQGKGWLGDGVAARKPVRKKAA